MATISQWQLRAAFAQRLSDAYGREVPAYTTLVEVSREVNRDVLARSGADAERLGSIGRVTAERHGAIRVGTPRELHQVARIFGALGMYPVGFYDLPEDEAERFLDLAVAAFALSAEPVDKAWYDTLEQVSAVAADIGGVTSTHVNHLTPRVLDIDELYRRMSARGIEMIDAIQGPPRWDGPDVLLRQTSFRALSEPRVLRLADGTVTEGSLRVRFGEVESRGIALTRLGRARYDALLTEVDHRAAAEPATPRSEVARAVWESGMPATELGLIEAGLGYFAYRLREDRLGSGTRPPTAVLDLLQQGWVDAEPIVYEDFLPRSAVGIFQSNLSGEGVRDTAKNAVDYDQDWLAGAIDREIHDPFALYEAQQNDPLSQLAEALDLRGAFR